MVSKLFVIVSKFIHGNKNQKERTVHTRTRANSIDSDAFANLLVGQSSCERNNGSLCRCIIEQVTSANIVIHRGAIDDC